VTPDQQAFLQAESAANLWLINLVQFVIVVAGVGFTVWNLRNAAQQLRSSALNTQFSMYASLMAPITDKDIAFLQYYPQDLLQPSIFNCCYRGNPNRIHKLIYLSKVYAYLAYTKEMNQPIFNEAWRKEWLKGLLNEDVFIDIHGYLKPYYSEFAKDVDNFKGTRAVEHSQRKH
jgi:hypothetical protein